MGFAFRIWENPLISMVPLGIILIQYFGGFRLPFGLPGGLVAVAAGVILSLIVRGPADVPAAVGLTFPTLALGSLFGALFGPLAWDFLAVSIPMGLATLVGSLMCLESAAVGGDRFETRSSLAVNGAGSLLAACLGSCFPTTIYIGHPAWKAVGARSAYSAVNGVVITLLCLTGLARGALENHPRRGAVRHHALDRADDRHPGVPGDAGAPRRGRGPGPRPDPRRVGACWWWNPPSGERERVCTRSGRRRSPRRAFTWRG